MGFSVLLVPLKELAQLKLHNGAVYLVGVAMVFAAVLLLNNTGWVDGGSWVLADKVGSIVRLFGVGDEVKAGVEETRKVVAERGIAGEVTMSDVEELSPEAGGGI